MDHLSLIGDAEIILRRVPPSSPGHETIVELAGRGRHRATSSTLKEPRPGAGLSCSRLKVTAPRELLSQLAAQGIDPAGWLVAAWRCSAIRSLGLAIRSCPTELDAGHCEIGDLQSGSFPSSKAIQSKLARLSRILHSDEVARLIAGDDWTFPE